MKTLECASGTTSSSSEELLFLIPDQYEDVIGTLHYEPGLWKFQSSRVVTYYIPSFSRGVFTCRMPDEKKEIVDISVGIYPDNYNKNGEPSLTPLSCQGSISIIAGLFVSLSYTQSDFALILICTSTGLPPTTVTWSKDGEDVCSVVMDCVFSQRVIDVNNTVYENTILFKRILGK